MGFDDLLEDLFEGRKRKKHHDHHDHHENDRDYHYGRDRRDPYVKKPIVDDHQARYCPSCGSEGSGKFCSQCGASLPVKKLCNGCGKELEPNARFCSSCGNKVS